MYQWLVFVRTAEEGKTKRKFSDALAIVCSDSDSAHAGVDALNLKFKDDPFRPDFCTECWQQMDKDAKAWALLSLDEVTDKSKRMQPWASWRQACRAIWGKRAAFRGALTEQGSVDVGGLIDVEMRNLEAELNADSHAEHPLRSGYAKPAAAELVDAVRKVVGDWDGTNWATVRAVLEHAGQSQKRIREMTLADIRQYFAVGQKVITLKLGGTPFTASNHVISGQPGPGIITVTKASAAGTAPPPMDDQDYNILRVLNRATTLLTQGMIAQRLISARTPLSEKTICEKLSAMRQVGLTERPKGIRKGERITDGGRKLLATHDAQVTV